MDKDAAGSEVFVMHAVGLVRVVMGVRIGGVGGGGRRRDGMREFLGTEAVR